MLRLFRQTTLSKVLIEDATVDILEITKKANATSIGEYAHEKSVINVHTREDGGEIKITSNLNVCTKRDLDLLQDIKEISLREGQKDIYDKVKEILRGE